jgi:hypothetical protein
MIEPTTPSSPEDDEIDVEDTDTSLIEDEDILPLDKGDEDDIEYEDDDEKELAIVEDEDEEKA